jgi:hypothetical protein
MSELWKSLGDGSPTAAPRVIEAAEPHFERVKPLFDVVSIK